MEKPKKSTSKKLAQVKAWQEAHKEQYLAKLREWRVNHPDYFKKYRKNKMEKNREYSIKSYYKNHDKTTARNKSRAKYIPRTGFCSFCGSTENLESHHLDYKKPFNIIAICMKCHKKLHSSLGENMKIENPCVLT